MVYVSSLSSGSKVEHQLGKGRKAYVFVIAGQMQLNNNRMQTRDAAKVELEDKVSVQAEMPTELIFLNLPEKCAINN
jgi:redox-sensitive bicupin YhaK (pirin superfamily)